MDFLSFQGSHFSPLSPTSLSAVVYISLNIVSTFFLIGNPLKKDPVLEHFAIENFRERGKEMPG
jgi:hypothetical protein